MNPLIKWVVILLGGIIGLVLAAGLALYGLGQKRLNRVYEVTPISVFLPDDEISLREGKRIFQYRGCEACHGERLEGLVYLDNPAVGQVITPNLTSGKGGVGGDRTDLDLVRAVRHGLRPDGTPLLFMPSTEFYYLSDQDLGAVLAYIRRMSPVDNQPDPSQLSTTGFMVMNLTREITFLPAELIPHDQDPPAAPEPGLSPGYGEYLALSCPVCHGLSFSGGEIPGFPPEWPAAGNLTPGKGGRLPSWGEEGFMQIIREGEKHGRAIHPDYMPWTSYRHLSDLELAAVYGFLISLPPKDFGNH
ncbi:MAG: cytochrome c [Anaerolineales bacterium]